MAWSLTCPSSKLKSRTPNSSSDFKIDRVASTMGHLHSDHRMMFEVQPGVGLQEAYSVRINLREAFGLVWLGFSRLYWSRLRSVDTYTMT